MTEFFLRANDDVAVIISEGKFDGICYSCAEDVRNHADEIHEAMIKIVKNTDFCEGTWLWIFKNHYEVTEGRKL